MHISLSDYLMDIVQNSFEAGASNVELTVDEGERMTSCSVVDNGKGMDEATQRRALDPFYSEEGKHRGRRFGLGLPFLHQAVDAAGGEFALQSEVGVGTTVRFSFDREHIDTPPVGDLALALSSLIAHPKAQRLVINRSVAGNGSYTLDRTELLDVLGEFETSGSLNLLRHYVASQEAGLHAGIEE